MVGVLWRNARFRRVRPTPRFFDRRDAMRRVLWICVGVIVAAGVRALGAEEDFGKSAAPWSIGKFVRCEHAEPSDLGDTTNDSPSSRYLHVRVNVRPRQGDVKLHQFRVADEKGKTVADLYGFHQGRSVLVFEGDWARMEGLYLEGAGHREPLIPARPSQKPVADGQAKPPSPRAEPPPAIVVPRRSTKSAKIERVEPEPPPAPQPERGEMHARQAKPTRRPVVEKPPKSEELYQEVLVTQRSRVNIQGLGFDGDLQYRVLSSLTFEKQNADGSLSVAQKVEQAEVIKADPLTQSVVGGLLNNLVGTTFQIAVGPDGRVTDFQGAKGRIRAAADNNPLNGQSFLMASILDPDGWREIADLTFFRPPAVSEARQTWDRAIAHSWGPLGSWSGKAAYARAGQEGDTEHAERIRYTYKLAYQAPKPGAGGLPFEIVRADFKHQEAGGTIAFDPAKGRVVHAEEHFPVKGNLTIGLLGQETPVELDETQDFRVRILDHRPSSDRR